MKNQQFFMPNRQLFMAGGETPSESEKLKKAPESSDKSEKTPDEMSKDAKAKGSAAINVQMEHLEELGSDKKPLDAKKYTEDPEITDKKSPAYKKIVEELLPKLKEMIQKRQNRDVRHGDVTGGQVDGKASFLAIDETSEPDHIRVFQAGKKTEAEGQKTEAAPFTPEQIKEKTKGYPEVKKPAGKDKTAYEALADALKKSGEEHGKTMEATVDNMNYVMLIDKTNKPDKRLFKEKANA